MSNRMIDFNRSNWSKKNGGYLVNLVLIVQPLIFLRLFARLRTAQSISYLDRKEHFENILLLWKIILKLLLRLLPEPLSQSRKDFEGVFP